MNLQDVIDYQAQHDLGDVHVVFIHQEGPYGGFHLAHTNQERARGENTTACRLHRWLESFGSVDSLCENLEIGPGLFAVHAHQPDAVSESYRSDPWELHLLERG